MENNNPYTHMLKQAGIGDIISGAMPMMGGALGGLGAGAGLGGMLGGPAKSIAPIIGAAMGAYAASQVDNAINQNAAGVDLNSQLAIQNGLMNLDQQAALDPYGMGMVMDPNMGMMPPMGGAGMGPMDGSGAGMGQGIGMPPMGGAGMGGGPALQQGGVVSGPGAINTMQKQSSVDSLLTKSRAAVFAYFNQ